MTCTQLRGFVLLCTLIDIESVTNYSDTAYTDSLHNSWRHLHRAVLMEAVLLRRNTLSPRRGPHRRGKMVNTVVKY